MQLLRSLTALVAMSASSSFMAFGLPSEVQSHEIEHKGHNHEHVKHVHNDIESFKKHVEKYTKNIHKTLEHAKPKRYADANFKINEDLRGITTASHDAGAHVTKDLKGASEKLTKGEANSLKKTCHLLQEVAQHLGGSGKEIEKHEMSAMNKDLVREKESIREGFREVAAPLAEFIEASKPDGHKARAAVKELKKEVATILKQMQNAFGASGPAMDKLVASLLASA